MCRVLGAAVAADALVMPTIVPATMARTAPDTTGIFTRALRDITLLSSKTERKRLGAAPPRLPQLKASLNPCSTTWEEANP
jgi:hypothetical protein